VRKFATVATIPSVPKWRNARCGLCTSPLLVRDDNEQVVCSACGARLEVLVSPQETRVRHIGEDLARVRETLDRQALERALERLRERREAQSEALRDTLQAAGVRRGIAVFGVLACVAGLVVALLGQGFVGTVVCFLGMCLALGGVGMRFGLGSSAYESRQRQREREATRAQQALAREITHRERLLAELDRG
jgi:uncharacterized Zn finger protein (UPF0148 family)